MVWLLVAVWSILLCYGTLDCVCRVEKLISELMSWIVMNVDDTVSVIVTVVIRSVLVMTWIMTYVLVFDSTSRQEHGG